MSTFDNPFDPARRLRSGCPCGQHASAGEHDAALQLSCAAPQDEAKRYEGVVASAVMRAVFPKEVQRRAFLKSVGASAALGVLSQFFPIKMATEVFAQGAGKLEKTDLKVDVVKTAGWAVIRDKTINKEYDAAHMLAPMPIAISLGLGS